MNTIKVTNLFTAVGFFVVTGFSNYASAAAPAECTTKVKNITITDVTNCSKDGGFETAADIEACNTAKVACTDAKNDAREDKADKRDASKEGDADCDEALTEYKKNVADADSACLSVVGSSSTGSSRYSGSSSTDSRARCSDKIKECAQMAQQTSAQTTQEDNGMSSTINIFRQVIGGEESLGLSSGNSCLVDLDSKEARDAEKEFRDRRKELEKEKKDIENDAIKDKEENDKEITRITKEVQELQRENKEVLAKADVRMREQLNASQKDMVDSAARLRNLTTQISKKNDSVRAINFAYADRMLDASTQKQNLRCKSALDQAKTCMIKSAKGIRDDACKDFPFKITSKGPKATAELKAQLQVVNDACYEKEERDKKRMNFDQQEQMKKVMDEMTELQAQAKEEGQRQQIQSENSTKISQEAEREKQEAEANMAQQIATLQGEMAQFAQKLEAKNFRTQERLKKLAEDLQKLELEEKTGKRSKTSLASTAVRKTEMDLTNVVSQCNCVEDIANAPAGKEANPGSSAKSFKNCRALKNALPAGGAGKKPSTGRSKSAF